MEQLLLGVVLGAAGTAFTWLAWNDQKENGRLRRRYEVVLEPGAPLYDAPDYRREDRMLMQDEPVGERPSLPGHRDY
jgi:hypothetical protein